MKIHTRCIIMTLSFTLGFLLIAPKTPAAVLSFQNGSNPTAGYAGNDVARLEERFPGSNFANATEGLVGRLATPDTVFHTVLSFDLSDIPSGATINSVSLNLFQTTDAGSVSSAVQFNLHELTQSFIENEVTWDDYSTGNAWTTPGGDFDSTILSSITVNPNTGSGAQTFNTSSDFVSLVQNSVDGSQNLNLLLKLNDADEASSNRYLFRFSTEDVATIANRPLLTVDFTPIPEPASATFFMLTGIGVLAFRSRYLNRGRRTNGM